MNKAVSFFSKNKSEIRYFDRLKTRKGRYLRTLEGKGYTGISHNKYNAILTLCPELIIRRNGRRRAARKKGEEGKNRGETNNLSKDA